MLNDARQFVNLQYFNLLFMKKVLTMKKPEIDAQEGGMVASPSWDFHYA